jgi:tartrate-resistant acid phosphatase type 5
VFPILAQPGEDPAGALRAGDRRAALLDRAPSGERMAPRWAFQPHRSPGFARRAVLAAMGCVSACFDPSDHADIAPQPSCPASTGLGRPGVRPPPSPEADAAGSLDADGGASLESQVRFAVIGDYGLDGPEEARVADLVASWNPDFVITTGDNNYYEGSASTIDQNIGKYYCQFIGNYLGKPGEGSPANRFWPSPGNHDWLAPGLRPYLDYFTLPGNERYYDVARGLVHLYAVDSDFSEPDGVTADSAQGAWLERALAASTACFDVVFFHHPPYSSGPHGSSLEMRWPFEAWGAEAVMAGHDHLYERLEVGQIPYLTVGLGGAVIYEPVTALAETRVQYSGAHGALRVTADRHGMKLEFINVMGRLVDTFTYAKECPPARR